MFGWAETDEAGCRSTVEVTIVGPRVPVTKVGVVALCHPPGANVLRVASSAFVDGRAVGEHGNTMGSPTNVSGRAASEAVSMRVTALLCPIVA